MNNKTSKIIHYLEEIREYYEKIDIDTILLILKEDRQVCEK